MAVITPCSPGTVQEQAHNKLEGLHGPPRRARPVAISKIKPVTAHPVL